MTDRTWAALAVAFLCLPPAAAEGNTPQATFQSASVSWQALSPLSGSVAGLQSRLAIEGSGQIDVPLTDSWFELKAANLHVEWDTATLYLDAKPVVTPLPPVLPIVGSSSVSTHESTHTNAVLHGSASRNDRSLHLFPLGPLAVVAPCAEGTPASDQELKAVSYVNTSRGSRTASIANALQFASCPDSSFILKGSVMVSMWEWDFNGTAQEGNFSFWSGKHKQETVPDLSGAVDPSPHLTQARQVFVIARDAIFTIRGNADRPPLLFMTDANLAGASRLSLTEATGQLGAASVSARRVDLSGDLTVRLGRSQGAVKAHVSGLRDVTVDGQAFSFASTTATPAPAWPWLVGAVGAVAALAAPVPLLRRRPRQRKERVQASVAHAWNAVASQQPKQALEWTSKASDLEPNHPEALSLRAKLLGDSAPGHALSLHEQVQGLSTDPFILRENALQAALTAARYHPEEAPAWLRRAVQANAHLTRDTDLEPFFFCHPELAPYAQALHEPESYWFLQP